jgi:hypothetical protein
MGTELPTEVMLGQTLVLMQMTFINNVRKVVRLFLSRTSCFLCNIGKYLKKYGNFSIISCCPSFIINYRN